MIRSIAFLFLFSLFIKIPAFALNVGDTVPAFILPSLDHSQQIDIKDFRGKVVYVDFWASWCVPCRVSFPLINNLYNEMQENGFEVIAINIDEDVSKAHKFLKNRPVNFTLASDASSQWPGIFGVQKMPSSYLIDRKGMVSYVHYGFHPSDMKEIRSVAKKLLEK